MNRCVSVMSNIAINYSILLSDSNQGKEKILGGRGVVYRKTIYSQRESIKTEILCTCSCFGNPSYKVSKISNSIYKYMNHKVNRCF